MAFILSKWYFDLIEPDGGVWIGYWSDLRYGPLHLRAAATFDGASDRLTMLRPPAPTVASGTVRWSPRRLGIEGSWTAVAGPPGRSVQRTLIPGRNGMRWTAHVPAGDAVLTGGERQRRGLGYAEELSLMLEPWCLPITTLRWGRVATARRSVVWIDWRGERPLSLVIVDGVEQRTPEIDDHRIAWAGGSLRLAPRRTIRDAPIGVGALRMAAPLRRLLPAGLLAMHETKWLGDATFHDGGSAPALYERVRLR